MQRSTLDRIAAWTLVAGAAAGASGLALGLLRRSRRQRAALRIENELDALEVDVVEALRRDAVTGSCAIDVAVVGPGIVELSGIVSSREAAQRAARLLHAVAGVRTVISRIEVGPLEAHLADNRTRHGRSDSDAASWDRAGDLSNPTPLRPSAGAHNNAGAHNTVM